MIDRVVVLHGYTANPSRHWFGWLAQELGRDGIDVVVPELPDPEAPHRTASVATAQRAIGRDGAGTVVVGHSLGAPTALHAIAEAGRPVAGLVTVAGFDAPVPGLPELDPFTVPAPDLDRVRTATGGRGAALLSDHDPVVPVELSRDLGRRWGVPLVTLPGAGHFMGSDGVTELPELATLIRGWIRDQTME